MFRAFQTAAASLNGAVCPKLKVKSTYLYCHKLTATVPIYHIKRPAFIDNKTVFLKK